MTRMLLLALVAISLFKTSLCVKATPGQPVPHAEVLEDLLSKFLGDSYSNNVLFDFMMGQPSQHQNNLTGDNLDISKLDVNNLQKIIAFAKRKFMNANMVEKNSRRHYYVKHTPKGMYDPHPYVVNKTFDLMKTAIYMTKEKINLTIPFRKKYNHFFSYQIAVLYGAAEALFRKLESYMNQMRHMWSDTHFIWFLILYERILACSIDINDSIEKLFIIQDQHEEVRGSMDSAMSIGGSNLTRAELMKLMQNPELAKQMGVTIPANS